MNATMKLPIRAALIYIFQLDSVVCLGSTGEPKNCIKIIESNLGSDEIKVLLSNLGYSDINLVHTSDEYKAEKGYDSQPIASCHLQQTMDQITQDILENNTVHSVREPGREVG